MPKPRALGYMRLTGIALLIISGDISQHPTGQSTMPFFIAKLTLVVLLLTFVWVWIGDEKAIKTVGRDLGPLILSDKNIDRPDSPRLQIKKS